MKLYIIVSFNIGQPWQLVVDALPIVYHPYWNSIIHHPWLVQFLRITTSFAPWLWCTTNKKYLVARVKDHSIQYICQQQIAIFVLFELVCISISALTYLDYGVQTQGFKCWRTQTLKANILANFEIFDARYSIMSVLILLILPIFFWHIANKMVPVVLIHDPIKLLVIYRFQDFKPFQIISIAYRSMESRVSPQYGSVV